MKRKLLQDGRSRTWFWMENRAVDDLWITFVGVHAWAVYCVLLRFADDKGRTFPSAREISDLTGVSLRQVRHSLKMLLSSGLIRRTKKGGPVSSTVYQVRDLPESKNGSARSQPEPQPQKTQAKATADFLAELEAEALETIGWAQEPEAKQKIHLTPKKKTGRKSKLPESWTPNDTHRRIATEEGVDIEREVTGFRDHAMATGRIMLDWDAAFRTWLRNARQFSRAHYGKAGGRSNGEHAKQEVLETYEREEFV